MTIDPETFRKGVFDEVDRIAAAPKSQSRRPNGKNGKSDCGATTPTASDSVFDPWQSFIVPSFPLDVLPEDVQQFVLTQSRVIGCDPSALAMCVLANASAAIDHRTTLRMMKYGNWHVSPRLWVLLVGEPSDKKTPAFSAATHHLVAVDNARWKAWDAACEQERKLDPKADPPPKPARLWTADTTVEACGDILTRQDRGILIRRDEIAGWIGSMERYASKGGTGSADRAFWLQAFDGGPFIIDRIKRGSGRIENLSVSILGGIQPACLGELDGLTSDGLLQRFVPVLMRHPTEPIDEPIGEPWEAHRRLIETLVNATPATVLLTDTARKGWTKCARASSTSSRKEPAFRTASEDLPASLREHSDRSPSSYICSPNP